MHDSNDFQACHMTTMHNPKENMANLLFSFKTGFKMFSEKSNPSGRYGRLPNLPLSTDIAFFLAFGLWFHYVSVIGVLENGEFPCGVT